MTIWITSGNRPSNGRKALQLAGGFRKANPMKMKAGDWLINWGCSDHGIWPNVKHLQGCYNVKTASNKLEAFIQFNINNVDCVEWTDEKTEAEEWFGDGKIVVVRNKLTGHSGDGIVIIDPKLPNSSIPDAPLYTKYVFKSKEFRVHVVGMSVVDTQQKIRDPNREVLDWKVRSHKNGFIFARNNIVADPVRDSLAISAITALGLDFGAVDLVQDKSGKYLVLEVNTAPGLEGQTVQSYATALKELCNSGYSS